jgi:hypothetical protein
MSTHVVNEFFAQPGRGLVEIEAVARIPVS